MAKRGAQGRTAVVLAPALALAMICAACARGVEGRRCFPNDTCYEGLACLSDRCVVLSPELAAAARRLAGVPEVPDDLPFPAATPASVGLDPRAVAAHEMLCERSEAAACLVLAHGKIVSAYYAPGGRRAGNVASVTKSITGLVAGLLYDDGKLTDLDAPVSKWIAGWADGDKGKATIRHLMTHAAGLGTAWGTMGGWGTTSAITAAIHDVPGARFEYSNSGVQILSPILEEIAGEPVGAFARRRLLEPLGITDSKFMTDPEGHGYTYGGFSATAADLLKIGALVLGKGVWKGRRIVSEKWIRLSTEPCAVRGDYGLLWWLLAHPAGFGAFGDWDNAIVVVPEHELVVIRTQYGAASSRATPWRSEGMALIGAMVGEEVPETPRIRSAPIDVPGWYAAGSEPDDYVMTLAHDVVHDGTGSGRIASGVATPRGFGTLMQWSVPDAARGKRVRMKAWVKTLDAAHAALWLRIDGPSGRMLGFDNMDDRPIRGKTDWTLYELVANVPPEATAVTYGVLLIGEGVAWIDDVSFESVGRDVAVTGRYASSYGRGASDPTSPAGTVEPVKGVGANLDFEEAAKR